MQEKRAASSARVCVSLPLTSLHTWLWSPLAELCCQQSHFQPLKTSSGLICCTLSSYTLLLLHIHVTHTVNVFNSLFGAKVVFGTLILDEIFSIFWITSSDFSPFSPLPFSLIVLFGGGGAFDCAVCYHVWSDMLCLCERHKLAETEAEKQQMLLSLHLLFAARSEQTRLHERQILLLLQEKEPKKTRLCWGGDPPSASGTHRGTGPAGWGPAKWLTELAAEAPTPGPPSSVLRANCRHLLCESPPGTQTAGRESAWAAAGQTNRCSRSVCRLYG